MKKGLVIAGVAVVVLAALMAVLLYARGGIEGRLRQQVLDELRQRMGGEFELDRVRVGDELVLEGLRWTPDSGRLASCSVEKMELQVDPRAVLEGDARLEGIRLIRPELVLAAGTGGPAQGNDTSRLLELAAGPLPEALADAIQTLVERCEPETTIVFEEAVVHGLPAGQVLLDVQGLVQVMPEGLKLDLSGRLDGGGDLNVDAELVPRRPVVGSFELRGVPLAALGDRLPDRAQWDGGVVDLHLDSRSEGGRVEIEGQVGIRELLVRLPEFADAPLAVESTHSWIARPTAQRLDVRDWRWTFNQVQGTGELALAGLPAEPEFHLELAIDDVSYEDIMSSLPDGIVPDEWGVRIAGALDLAVRLEGPLDDRSAWDLDWEGDWTRLSLSESYVGDGVLALRDEFPFTIALGDGTVQERRMGPSDPHFIDLRMINPQLVGAVLVCEDAGFYRHPGFDEGALKEAVRENLREDGGGRGGSTITQQVAKNLYLSGERTFTRKIQEAVLACSLESALDKQRILEIYLNRAEFGPGVYGVRDAAHHYFGTSTMQLNTLECMFLASQLPSPVEYHNYYHRGGQVSPRWEAHLRHQLDRMRLQGHLTDDQFEWTRTQTIRFAPCDLSGP